MARLQLSSGAEQVAAHLRGEILGGRWWGSMPGRARLARELGVSGKLVEAGLAELEREGLLESQGPRKRRRVVTPKGSSALRPLRVRLLAYDRESQTSSFDSALFHQLREAGISPSFPRKTLEDLGMNSKRVARFVARTPGDAWVVLSGSQEIVEWFAHQPIPAMAVFGRFTGLPIAATSPRKVPAMVKAVRRLVSLGHRRIVMMARPERRQPQPALFERRFLEELAACGIKPGPYNLPDWPNTAAGFRNRLDSLFEHTSPTALIIEESQLFTAASHHLTQRGIVAPRDVSLICDDDDTTFAWCAPAISHIRWDQRPVIRRVLAWTRNIARGEEDKRQTLFDAEFVEGGTIGPVP